MKYEITNIEHPTIKGLFRIRALKRSFFMRKGDLGGFVESEKNLSQDGKCWILDNACVYENAIVSEDAYVSGTSQVYGNAHVSGYSKVYGNAKVNKGKVTHKNYNKVCKLQQWFPQVSTDSK